jgi:hypothetical protein
MGNSRESLPPTDPMNGRGGPLLVGYASKEETMHLNSYASSGSSPGKTEPDFLIRRHWSQLVALAHLRQARINTSESPVAIRQRPSQAAC